MSATKDKKYDLAVLADLCGGTVKSIAATLPWHELRNDGLWLAEPPALIDACDRETWRWQPRENSSKAALPVPFSAPELAAFMLAGGGLYLHERFAGEHDDGEQPNAKVLAAMGTNAGEARAAMTEAFRLRRMATDTFGRNDDGVRRAAASLLGGERPIDESTAAGTVADPVDVRGHSFVHSTRGTRSNLMTSAVESAIAHAGSGADPAKVWAALESMARRDDRPPPLVGVNSGGVQYHDGGTLKTFTRRALGDRLRRAERRDKPR